MVNDFINSGNYVEYIDGIEDVNAKKELKKILRSKWDERVYARFCEIISDYIVDDFEENFYILPIIVNPK